MIWFMSMTSHPDAVHNYTCGLSRSPSRSCYISPLLPLVRGSLQSTKQASWLFEVPKFPVEAVLRYSNVTLEQRHANSKWRSSYNTIHLRFGRGHVSHYSAFGGCLPWFVQDVFDDHIDGVWSDADGPSELRYCVIFDHLTKVTSQKNIRTRGSDRRTL